ncbi:alpha/beta hydrolase [Roseomonas populi]|uniref:Alpha/beta hydrolase-fold protein n=1 Tax=Roseomonas populi TaxID=3121582 RepID=A0ABT1X7V1_9PROT|nr:alpha/beta hydrolase-fold protein [Roseomonas pecuniae]MCR0983222.1 alpha/beta hydrolase-fold protein [Roseomonas pecuniae]
MIGAAPVAGPLQDEPVALPRSASWIMRAGEHPARLHRILLSWPEAPVPSGGYPVLFLADGGAAFPTAAEIARLRTGRGAKDVGPGLVVGLGHAGEGPYDRAARTRDYTPSFPAAPAGTGGADAFLDFILGDLLPELERRFPVDRARLALFGHSFGGLLALYAFLSRPGLFHRVAAASPSLWFAEGAPMEMARRFAAAPPPAGAGSSLLLTVGGLEEADDGTPRGPVRVARRMVTRARDLATILRGGGVSVDFTEFPGENHGSVLPAALSRAVPFALPPALPEAGAPQ